MMPCNENTFSTEQISSFTCLNWFKRYKSPLLKIGKEKSVFKEEFIQVENSKNNNLVKRYSLSRNTYLLIFSKQSSKSLYLLVCSYETLAFVNLFNF